jgi:hypothetical protein
MSLAELIPLIQALPLEDRRNLLGLLRAELEPAPKGEPDDEMKARIAAHGEFPIFTPLDCYAAAEVLQRLADSGQSK